MPLSSFRQRTRVTVPIPDSNLPATSPQRSLYPHPNLAATPLTRRAKHTTEQPPALCSGSRARLSLGRTTLDNRACPSRLPARECPCVVQPLECHSASPNGSSGFWTRSTRRRQPATEVSSAVCTQRSPRTHTYTHTHTHTYRAMFC